MVSKLILLLGALIGGFIAYTCVQNNKGLLTSLEQTPPIENQVLPPKEIEPQTTTPTQEPVQVVEMKSPSFFYTNIPAQQLSISANSADKTDTLVSQIEKYCQEPQCKKELYFADEINSTSPWKENVFKIVAFFQTHQITPASVKIENNTLYISGNFPDEDTLNTFKTLLTPFQENGITIEEDLKLLRQKEEIPINIPQKQEIITPSGLQDIKTEVQQEKEPETKEIPLEDIQQKNIQNMQEEISTLLKNNPIYFKTNSNELTLESKKILDKIIDIVNKNTKEIKRLRILGHTDASGSAAYNKLLSQKRAERVREYLIEHNIKINSLEAEGYGEEKPISENPYAKENRRVEIEIKQEASHD